MHQSVERRHLSGWHYCLWFFPQISSLARRMETCIGPSRLESGWSAEPCAVTGERVWRMESDGVLWTRMREPSRLTDIFFYIFLTVAYYLES